MPVPIPGSKVGSDSQKVKFLTISGRPKTRFFDKISGVPGRAPLATNHAAKTCETLFLQASSSCASGLGGPLGAGSGLGVNSTGNLAKASLSCRPPLPAGLTSWGLVGLDVGFKKENRAKAREMLRWSRFSSCGSCGSSLLSETPVLYTMPSLVSSGKMDVKDFE